MSALMPFQPGGRLAGGRAGGWGNRVDNRRGNVGRRETGEAKRETRIVRASAARAGWTAVSTFRVAIPAARGTGYLHRGMDHTAPDADRIAEARAFAIAAHGTQKYAGRPYVFHLDAVAKLLEP